MDTNESIGVVSGAYSVGRMEILKWINDFAQLNYTKIEETASGVFVCHVFDALYPGQLRLGKVKFDAKHSYDFVHNYKVLQACFNRVGMKRQVNVEKLIKGKYQDNLEFMQWLKAYFEAHASEEARNYNGLARRQEMMGRAGSISSTDSFPLTKTNSRDLSAPTRKTTTSSPRTANSPNLARTRRPVQQGTQQKDLTIKKLREEVAQLKVDKEELQATVEDAVTEREFYFNKLRKVELIYQAANEEQAQHSVDFLRDALDDIRNILYAEEDEPVEENPEQEEAIVDGEEIVEGQFDDDEEDAVYQDGHEPAERNGH